MATNPKALTADDVLDLPDPEGGTGWEFVDGRPVPVMVASPIHGRLIVRAAYLVENFVREHGLPGVVYSDSGFVLGLRRDRERMRGPDVSYVAREKVEAHFDPERFFRCVPDLAIEIDLASGRKSGGQQRIVDYLEAGVRLVWSIDPRSRTAMVYRPDGSARLIRETETLDGAEVLPGFGLLLSDLFS